MKGLETTKMPKIFFILILFLSLLYPNQGLLRAKAEWSLRSLLPKNESWKYSEDPQNYFPATLYEYINGAAEIYLAYDFKELAVGQYKRTDADASLSVEIYDMGNEKNSFGIYSAERFPDTRFVSVGNQGYFEEGALNFIVGRYYIKLLCFDCGNESEGFLRFFADDILRRIKDKGQMPPLLKVFPGEGLIANSEKFILHNFLGHAFLHDGYLAHYKKEELQFDCFLVEGESPEEAQSMLDKYLAYKKERVEERSFGYCLKDRYYHNVYLARVKNYLCGVLKIRDGFEEVGEKYLKVLVNSLKSSLRPH